MLNKTLVAAARKSAGGDNVYYIGDTKEKGLEAIGYCAKFARVIARAQGEGVTGVEEFLFEDQDEGGKTKHITAYRIRFASGFQVCALSSRPANIRGLQGHVVIDEAAFHPDVQGVLEAATALLIWGGQITIISSHNGKNNPFAQLCRDIEAGRYGADAAVVTVTFDDAVTNGLYERVCFMKGTPPTAEGKREWYSKIRNAYGVRKAAMREELDAIPRDGSGVSLPGVWIENAMSEERPVVRLALDDDFVRKSEAERRSFVEDWIRREVEPALTLVDPKLQSVFAQDFARHRDFSVFGVGQIEPNLRRRVVFVVEMHKVPTRQQEQVIWHIIERLPRRCGGAMDATGSAKPGRVHGRQVRARPRPSDQAEPGLVRHLDAQADPGLRRRDDRSATRCERGGRPTRDRGCRGHTDGCEAAAQGSEGSGVDPPRRLGGDAGAAVVRHHEPVRAHRLHGGATANQPLGCASWRGR